jgi:NAD(P)-dependent dehydrogenase (short-subunit alcohol dehydrogenase family)
VGWKKFNYKINVSFRRGDHLTREQSKRVWFITGSSSGFGRLLGEHVLSAGEYVAATARDLAKISDLEEKFPGHAKAIRLDVTDKRQVAAAVDQALAAFGHIDVLVNNAGYGLVAAQEEASDEEIRQQIDTNIFGVIHVTRAVLPHMRKQRSGHIVNLSSIAGLVGTPGLGYYNLTKFALEGMSEALALEVAPLGIHITLIEPGPFRTDFAGRSGVYSPNQIADYADTAGKMRANQHAVNGKQKGDPLRAIQVIQQAVNSQNPPLHLILGAFALNKFRNKIAQFEKEMSQWESVTLGADFPDDEAR